MSLDKVKLSAAVIFLVASSLYFSNLLGEKTRILNIFPISSVFTLFALVISGLLLNSKAILYGVVIIFLVVVNFLIQQGLSFNLLLIMLKALSLLSIWIALDYLNYKQVFKIIFFSYILSNLLAVCYICFEIHVFRQVLYPGYPPRYAGLAIEPAGFSLGTLSLIYVYYLSRSKIDLLTIIVSYLPFILAISSAILVKAALDGCLFLKMRLRNILFFGIISLVSTIILLTSRAWLSISTRLDIYYNEIQKVNWTFLGKGYGLDAYAALPGLLKFPAEAGLLIGIFCYLTLVYKIIQKRLYERLIFIPIFSTPFLTETYGAVLLWIPIFLLMKRGYIR